MPASKSICGLCSGPAYKCRACENIRQREYRRAHPDRTREIQVSMKRRKRLTEQGRDQLLFLNRKSYLKQQHNLSLEEWEIMFDFQDGSCAICRRPWEEGQRRLNVDHDHKTGLIRGLLCWSCNMRLAERITANWLVDAYSYLDSPPAIEALGEERYGRRGRVSRLRRKKA